MRRNKTQTPRNGAVGEAARENHDRDDGALRAPHVHLIRIADHEAMKRAVVVLGEVRVPYCGFPDSQLLVANEHLETLLRAAVPFEKLT